MSNATTVTAQPGQQFVDIDRIVDAPIADVYRAYSEPDLIAQWLGPHGYEMDVAKFDFRNGGEWAYVHRGPEGEFVFHGSFHSVEPLVSITQTFEYAGAPGHVSLERTTFEDLGGSKTRISGHAVYQSIEDRDAMIASGMEHGVVEGFERLDTLLG